MTMKHCRNAEELISLSDHALSELCLTQHPCPSLVIALFIYTSNLPSLAHLAILDLALTVIKGLHAESNKQPVLSSTAHLPATSFSTQSSRR